MKKILISLLVLGIQLTVASAAAPEPTEPKPELPTTGINLPRPVSGWINVEAVGIRLVVKFFDQDKEPLHQTHRPDLSGCVIPEKVPSVQC